MRRLEQAVRLGLDERSSHEAFAVSNAYKFPACMRDNGVTNFPDPQVNGTHPTLQITPSISASPAFKSAPRAPGSPRHREVGADGRKFLPVLLC